MVIHVLRAASALRPARIAVVVGWQAERVRETVARAFPGVSFVDQPELLGTGDAVRRCRDALAGCDEVLVLNADSPLVTPQLLERLREARGDAPVALAYARVPDDGRFGRLLRDSSGVIAGVREIPPGTEARGTGLVERNGGQYVFEAIWLWEHLARLSPSETGEYYLTDLVAAAYAEGRPAVGVETSADELIGVDDRVALAQAESLLRERILRAAMAAGVTIVDPRSTYIDADVELEEDVTILPGCHLYGRSRVRTGSVLGPNTILRDAEVGRDCRIEASVVERSRIGERVRVGPFAHLRDGADIGDDCELGNYAEVKNSRLGPRVKMHHFSYIGDADVGEDTNIAAGTITCNFDGVRKHRTIIGKRVFIGSDTMLVAPVTLGDGSATGAGAVVTRDVPPGVRVVGVPARILPPKDSSEGQRGE